MHLRLFCTLHIALYTRGFSSFLSIDPLILVIGKLAFFQITFPQDSFPHYWDVYGLRWQYICAGLGSFWYDLTVDPLLTLYYCVTLGYCVYKIGNMWYLSYWSFIVQSSTCLTTISDIFSYGRTYVSMNPLINCKYAAWSTSACILIIYNAWWKEMRRQLAQHFQGHTHLW